MLYSVFEDGLRLVILMMFALVLVNLYRFILTVRPGGFGDYDQLVAGNLAAMWLRSGRYAGLLIALSGSALGNQAADIGTEILTFAVNGVITVAVFLVLVFLLDLVILWKINNTRQVRKGNMAVAVVECLASLAMGFIMAGSFTGEGAGFWTGILSAVAFSGVGIVLLAVLYLLYELVTRWSVERELANGNVAAAFEVGSFMLGMGIVLMFSIAGDFTGWASDFASFGAAAVVGVVVLTAGRELLLSSWRLLPPGQSSLRHHAHHGQMPVAVMLSVTTVGLAALVGASL